MSNTASAADVDRYVLVSGLYGPGMVVGWFLMIVSCFVSWTIHPRKRLSGSIDSDLIAILTLPVIATGHLISQLFNYPGRREDMMTTTDVYLPQRIAAIEAPLNIVETSMAVSVILFLLAIVSDVSNGLAWWR